MIWRMSCSDGTPVRLVFWDMQNEAGSFCRRGTPGVTRTAEFGSRRDRVGNLGTAAYTAKGVYPLASRSANGYTYSEQRF